MNKRAYKWERDIEKGIEKGIERASDSRQLDRKKNKKSQEMKSSAINKQEQNKQASSDGGGGGDGVPLAAQFAADFSSKHSQTQPANLCAWISFCLLWMEEHHHY